MQINPNNHLKNNYYSDLAHLGLLKISGNRSKELLQGQLTCQMDDITSEQSRLGAHCNPKGRIISFFRIFLIHYSYYLQMPLELIPIAKKALEKYAIFFKVEIEDATNDLHKIIINSNQFSDKENESKNLFIFKIADESPHYEVFGSKNDIDELTARLNASDIKHDNLAWQTLETFNFIPNIYPETSEVFLPHELGLPKINAVNFQKGCYTGQEIIARMEYRGKLKSKLELEAFASNIDITRGNDLTVENGNKCQVVDYCTLSNNEILAMIITK